MELASMSGCAWGSTNLAEYKTMSMEYKVEVSVRLRTG
jgi:hypothetical protein